MINLKESLIEVGKEYGVGEGMLSLFDVGLDLAPYIGQLNQTRKINRVERRIKEHSVQLQRINQLYLSNILSQEFIQEKIGPIVLSDLIEEHEEAKIYYILNGFENVFIDRNNHEGIIINYFDTLRSLRYEDIKWLYYYAAITEEIKGRVIKSQIEESFYQQIYTKLERLYLIKSASTWEVLEEGAAVLNEEARKTELTPYGIDFIKFISKDFDFNRYTQRINKYNNSFDKKLSESITPKFG